MNQDRQVVCEGVRNDTTNESEDGMIVDV